jgi:hypothetical protein
MRGSFSSRLPALLGALAITIGSTSMAAASTPAGDVRLTNDAPSTSGYTSNYTMVTGNDYTDAALDECSKSRGRENEPSVAVNPRDTRVIVGSSNDYCAVYDDGENADGAPIASGPIWLGYYRSTDSGASFSSSLVPGYPGDPSPYASRARIRTASSGDPVLAWDNHGRLFAGSESSDDPAGTLKTFGDVWVATYENPEGENGDTLKDGLEFKRSEVVARGVSAPYLLGKFNDKTAIEVDRTSGSCDGNVYFSWSRFTGNGGVAIYFSRSTDHGATWSSPMKLSASIHDVQFPDIAVTANGHVYVTFRQLEAQGQQTDAIDYVRSTDCGASFGPVKKVTTFTGWDLQDQYVSGGSARDCGDLSSACVSGYTFWREDSSPRSTADQLAGSGDETVYIVYNASKPGTEAATGTTYGSEGAGTGSQSGAYFVTLDGATGSVSDPVLIDPQATGHQIWPAVSADGGVLHVLWWDTRHDGCYSVLRPPGMCADASVTPSLDVYATSSSDGGASFASAMRVTDVTSAGNYDQFADRTVPFAGDYLWISSVGSFSYGVWTDYRNTVAGNDPRSPGGDGTYGPEVKQCRTLKTDGTYTGDTCPRAGGLDQDIYGDLTP